MHRSMNTSQHEKGSRQYMGLARLASGVLAHHLAAELRGLLHIQAQVIRPAAELHCR